GIAWAKLDGADVELFADIRFFAFGSLEVGALLLGFEGERVSVDRLEGIVVTVQDFIDREVVPLKIETARATKDTCE
ncbi:MAG: hypothetical protein IID43_06720, partial [Planctomycetes bacterium]|nr:hypothetical protein [Planctomycetota bacterium]